MRWGDGLTPAGKEHYLLLRRNPDTDDIEGISFTGGIIHRMDISEFEWKPLDKTVSEDI